VLLARAAAAAVLLLAYSSRAGLQAGVSVDNIAKPFSKRIELNPHH
jgi:hypothetical protein